MLLLVLGAGLAVTSSFQQMYTITFTGGGIRQTMVTTLWGVTWDLQTSAASNTADANGLSVLITAVSMVVAAVLVLRPRTAHLGRPVAMGAAGALGGVVLAFVFEVRERANLVIGASPGDAGQSTSMTVHSGVYLLVAGVLLGLAGAALAQRKHEEQQGEEGEEDEVVVHQLDDGDDTPPFGIAMPEHEQQEAR